MEWYSNKLLSKCFLRTTDWNIAWKRKYENSYHILPNPLNYWLADPLIYNFRGKDYLFVEAFDKIENIGKIAVIPDFPNNISDFNIILEESYHLSYPFVFSYDKESYMIPETSGNGTIELYRANNFPHKWNKEIVLKKGNYVDTTLYYKEGDNYWVYSYDMSSRSMCFGHINMRDLKLEFTKEVSNPQYTLRSGGTVFCFEDKLCRPVQNNTNFYGQELIIVSCENNIEQYRINPEDIDVDNGKKYKRLHTYSCGEEYEVIDLSNIQFDLLKVPRKILKELKQ